MAPKFPAVVEGSNAITSQKKKVSEFFQNSDLIGPNNDVNIEAWKLSLQNRLEKHKKPGWPPLFLRNILRENSHLETVYESSDLESRQESLLSAVLKLRAESEKITVVRKDRVFEDDVTEEEQKIIDMRVQLQQQQFKLYKARESARKIFRIKSMFEFLRHEEIVEALERVGNDEDTVCINLTQPDYLLNLRKEICIKHESQNKKVDRTEEQEIAYNKLVERRRRIIKKTTADDVKQRCIKYSRLRLDDALQQLEKANDPDKVFEGWSEARIRAYRQIKTKPNSYYYRFNAPGEKQRNGMWTTEERKLFFKRLAEVGANGQWGLFSMTIPGRVGYQCSNFYRSMLKSGDIQDENYTVDEKGELRYLFGKKDGKMGLIRMHSKSSRKSRDWEYEDEDEDEVVVSKKKRNFKNMRNSSNSENTFSDGDVDGFEESHNHTNWNTTSRTKARYNKETPDYTTKHNVVSVPANVRYENPLPGFIDPITLEEVIRPAISPYGHVMSYSSWTRCLSAEGCKNICPLTKRTLKKRELTVLTFDNIDQYRDKISNI